MDRAVVGALMPPAARPSRPSRSTGRSPTDTSQGDDEMTAGQNTGQLRRANPSGMLVVAAVAAGAVAIGILATLAVARPAAVAPAAAPVPVPPIEFRLDEKGINKSVAVPWSVPVPPIEFRLEEKGISKPATVPWSVPVPSIEDRLGEHDRQLHRRPPCRGPCRSRSIDDRLGEHRSEDPGRRSPLHPGTAGAGHPGQALQQLLPALGHERPVTSRRPWAARYLPPATRPRHRRGLVLWCERPRVSRRRSEPAGGGHRSERAWTRPPQRRAADRPAATRRTARRCRRRPTTRRRVDAGSRCDRSTISPTRSPDDR